MRTKYLTKMILIFSLFLLLAGITASTFAQAPVTHEASSVTDIHLHSDGSIMSDQDDKDKVPLLHFDHWGNWTGRMHNIDYELYNALVDAILGKGGLPTQENIDRLYHESGYGR